MGEDSENYKIISLRILKKSRFCITVFRHAQTAHTASSCVRMKRAVPLDENITGTATNPTRTTQQLRR